jgi:hypothetical protein
MHFRTLLVLALPVVACSSSTPTTSQPATNTGGTSAGGTSSAAAGSTSQAGASGSSAAGADSLAGTGGSPASAGSGGASTGGSSGTGGAGGMSTSAGGGTNMVPATYTGTPFKPLTIPGIIYAADYDKGGAGVAFCRVGAANPPTPATCMTAKLNDWCCSPQKGCDERTQPTVCPIYRMDADNAGLSHMNTGEPDNYASSGPTWVDGPTGPTLTGPMVTAGSPVPSHMNTTEAEDTYLSYLYTGQWEQYTVQVSAAGTYAIGGLFASPGATITLDFGGGVTSGPVMVPVSPVANCKCPETYHSWNTVSNMGQVTFPAAGTYLMRFTLTASQFNPLFFTFSKM